MNPGSVVVITGASSGLGVAFAEAFAQEGCRLVLCARRVEQLEGTRARVQQLGAEVIAVRADVAAPADCQAVADAAIDQFGAVDVLINNAGVATAVPATREDPADFARVVDINLNGSFHMAQVCARVMQPGSSILNIASIIGLTTAGKPQAAYAASKAGVIGLTRDLALQWTGRKGIRVNALAPGYFLTEMTAATGEEYLAQMAAHTPMGRLGEGHELAAAAVFLSGPGASYISGAVLPVDGGFLAN